MKFKKIACTITLSLCVNNVYALTQSCDLKSKPLPNLTTLSALDSQTYYQRLDQECKLQKAFIETQNKLSEYQVHPENITIYQALRYVERSYYEAAKYNNTPVSLIYQRHKSDYANAEAKTQDIWKNWSAGILQLEPNVDRIIQKQKFILSDLQQVHRGFYQYDISTNSFKYSDESGDFSHIPYPGKIKPAYDHDNPWWSFKTEEERLKNIETVNRVNSYYKNLGLLSNIISTDPLVNNIFNIKENSIYSGDTRANEQHVIDILNMMNTLLEQSHNGQHMIWQNKLFTPAELAFFVQQFYVRVHPFFEGNGRTSRFLQEIIMRSFNLPHGSSGDLMNDDVLTEHDQYYQKAINKTLDLLNEVNRCADEVYKEQFKFKFFSKKTDIKKVDQSQIEYNCRILD